MFCQIFQKKAAEKQLLSVLGIFTMLSKPLDMGTGLFVFG
jgi:hypothetical protein